MSEKKRNPKPGSGRGSEIGSWPGSAFEERKDAKGGGGFSSAASRSQAPPPPKRMKMINEAEPEPKPEKKAPEKKEKGPIVLTRRSAFFYGAGVVFLMVWVFVLGVMAGRGGIFQNPAFRRLEEKLALANPAQEAPVLEIPGQTPTPAPEEEPREPVEPELTFYKALAQDDPPRVIPEEKSADRPKPPPEKKKPDEADQSENDPDKRGPLDVASGVRTVVPEESAAPPPARSPGENFTVQIAAAPTAEKAQAEVDKLRAKGFDGYYYQVELKGRKYFRVRVGRYGTRDEARAMFDKLTEAGYTNLFISALTD